MQALKKTKTWAYLSWARDRFGATQAITRWRPGLVSVPVHNGLQVLLRPGTTDQVVYDEVFRSGEYDLHLGDPKVIIDAGAHLGFAAIYLAERYPSARII